MNCIILIVIALGIVQPHCVEAELRVVTTEFVCPVANPKYFKDVDVHMIGDGHDNELFANVTLIKYFPDTGMAFLKVSEASTNGEYVIFNGLDVKMPHCDAVREPVLGSRIFQTLGVDPAVCPSPPGVYGTSKLKMVDTNAVPETMVPNKYLVEFGTNDGDECIYYCKHYFAIE